MSASQQKFLDALKTLNIPAGGIVRYSQIADALNFVPHKMMMGKETKTLLKVGSQKYKEAIQAEAIKRANALLGKKKPATKQTVQSASMPSQLPSGEARKMPKMKLAVKGKKAKVIKPLPKAKKPRKFVKRQLIREFAQKNFAKYAFQYENNESLEDLYKSILEQIDALQDITNLEVKYIIVLFDTDDGKGGRKKIARTLIVDSTISYDMFEREYNKIVAGDNGKTVGSDPINTDETPPDYNNFSFILSSISQGSKSDSILFKSAMIESKEDLCGELCFNKCGFSAKQFGYKPTDLRSLETLISIIKTHRLPIEIIANGFTLKKRIREIVCGDKVQTIEIEDKKKKCSLAVADLSFDDINLIVLGSPDDCDEIPIMHTLVYDEVNKHIDYLERPIALCDDVKISLSSNVIKGGKIIFTSKTMNTNNLTTKVLPYEYLFFDYETVIDFNMSNCMQAYSLSILNLTPDELSMLDTLDSDSRDPEKRDLALAGIASLRARKCTTFLGYDCGRQFVDWFNTNSNHKMFIFIGFNNTNFDNFLMLEDFLQYNEEHSDNPINISEIFYNGSQLLNFKIEGVHNFFDIRKHLVGSLKANCASFKIESCAKKSFDHAKAQSLHEDGALIEFITGNEELKEYNEYDVLATAVLYKRYQSALAGIEATSAYARRLHDIKTIGSLIYKVFEDNKKKLGFDLPKLTYQQYTDMQRSKIAGRVEMFNGVQEVKERLASTDVCSLYPFVMSVLNVYYPCGKKLVEVSEYQGDDVLGFYYCDIDQSNLRASNLPNIYAKKSDMENDWSYTGLLENYLISNVMVGLLLKYGCSVVIKSGFVFKDKKKSCDMFGFLLDMMEAKNVQDSLKGKDGYNPALRETLKLLMNSLSGKVIEGLHTEKTVDIDSASDYLKIVNKAKSVNFINSIGGKMFLTYEVDAESICAQQQRPIYLGVLIYDYAKRYMYENSYSKIGLSKLLYTDTDASKFRYRDFLVWKQWVDDNNVIVPHWPEVELKDPRYANHKIYETGSKVFGSYEDELEEYLGDSYVFYCLEKKSWLYSWTVDGKVKSKYRFKGLNGSAQLLSLDEPFIDKRVITHSDGSVEEKYFVKPESEYEVYRYYEDHKLNNIESGNELKFFQQVYNTGGAYVLNSSFRKIVKNSARNVVMEDSDSYNNLLNKIQVNYMMKRIQIRR